METKNLWNSFLCKIKEELSPIAYETWFSETKLFKLEDNTAKIIVPMHIHKKNLKENYNDLIEEIFTDVSGSNFKFEYYLEEELENNIEIDTDNIGVPSNNNYETNLNTQYNFDNFIVGQSNKFAHATALAVAENPGYMYNPLFIYGNSGLGKTHLMHAIGNYIVKNSNKNVLYVTSEKFVSDFIGINKKNKDGNNENVALEEEFVNVLEDGTRLNKSDKLHEKKEFDGMEITDFQLTEKENVTLLLGTITNTSNEKKGGYPVNIKVVDKQGNEIITVAAFFGELEPGQSTQLSTSATFDYANAYDFSITKK